MITGLSFCSLRSEADSNRCSSFCRAEPSHSAIGPSNPIYVNRTANIRKRRGEVTFLGGEMYFRGMGLHKYYANALTMGNLLSGVLVIIGLFIWPFGAAVNGNLTGESFSEYGALAQGERGWGMLALAMIWMAGQLFDLLDGIVARWTRTEGPMGLQLDSIADAVSSGVTPAIAGIMFLHAWAPAIPAALKFLPLTMAMAATWRLARFNVEYAAGSDGTGFRGMPAPAGALWWIGILLDGCSVRDVWFVGFVWNWGHGHGCGASVFIGSTLIPWWMISDRPMMDLKGWGKTPEYDRKRIVLLVALVALLESWWQFLAGAFGLGLQAALLLYAILGGCTSNRHQNNSQYDHDNSALPLTSCRCRLLLDPQGKAVSSNMHNIGLAGIGNVRIGKHITLEVEAANQAEAEEQVKEACEKLLTNQIMEQFEFHVEAVEAVG